MFIRVDEFTEIPITSIEEIRQLTETDTPNSLLWTLKARNFGLRDYPKREVCLSLFGFLLEELPHRLRNNEFLVTTSSARVYLMKEHPLKELSHVE